MSHIGPVDRFKKKSKKINFIELEALEAPATSAIDGFRINYSNQAH